MTPFFSSPLLGSTDDYYQAEPDADKQYTSVKAAVTEVAKKARSPRSLPRSATSTESVTAWCRS